ncbi:hypothetical protein LJC46_07300 [Desulfovibrio sp. OttesenSCG-928-G15]|nr:hypothetical protein [Desulfovibrio sp. OttesenSCG-928-G15]
MAALNYAYLLELEEYLSSGAFTEDFGYSPEERRLEMLQFMEKLMDLGELSDEVATKIIFRRRGEDE